MADIRLDRYISRSLGLSRSRARKAVSAGKVTVNGKTANGRDMKIEKGDMVMFEGTQVNYEEYVYVMLNKPEGVVCSTNDPQTTVVDLVKEGFPGRELYPVGRLDKDSTGFVLLTDDGDFTHRVISPSSGIFKKYNVTVDSPITDEVVAAFRWGVTLRDFTILDEANMTVSPDRLHAEIQISQGVYHQIKRMFGVFGIGVVALDRFAIGGLTLDPSLAPGEYRKLTEEEIRLIFK